MTIDYAYLLSAFGLGFFVNYVMARLQVENCMSKLEKLEQIQCAQCAAICPHKSKDKPVHHPV